MKTAENDAVRQYLTAVEREASALPDERRQELLADLAEHIDVTLAERPDGSRDDDAVRDVLRGLGDPRTIAATALGETGPAPAGAAGPSPVNPARRTPSARAKIPAWITVVLLAVATPVELLGVEYAAAPLRIAGIVMLWVTLRWTTAQKVWATVLTFAAILIPNVIMLGLDPAGDLPWHLVHTVQVIASLALSAWLWTARRRA